MISSVVNIGFHFFSIPFILDEAELVAGTRVAILGAS
jgi:hypothetical protein